ncbi:hypothetical protein CDD81_1444 [Ophiocordyceps australis]|uniref:Uncharacterized protein n=1 Tax=Ophiocordyceps australis TaxID=1399860 RepID=A0A2C5XFD4_9HYPO|nr:hypothetical protein CDD81_1444 [Ophiocordyceps australis]
MSTLLVKIASSLLPSDDVVTLANGGPCRSPLERGRPLWSHYALDHLGHDESTAEQRHPRTEWLCLPKVGEEANGAGNKLTAGINGQPQLRKLTPTPTPTMAQVPPHEVQ